ncbi:MAG: hypothetical protein SNH94_07000 [Rikenellaceae bacterium]
MEEQTFNYYALLHYRTFNNNCLYKGAEPNKLFTTKDDQINIQPLWRMEQLAKYYGVNICDYDDQTSWEYYDEVMWQIDSKEEREKFREENLHLDTYDDYFEEVARVAAEIGAERAEIKCLIKSLMLKYRLNRIGNITEFPHEPFTKLYNRLVSSKDLEQILVAERLARHHIRELEMYIWCNTTDKKMQAGWVEREDEHDY